MKKLLFLLFLLSLTPGIFPLTTQLFYGKAYVNSTPIEDGRITQLKYWDGVQWHDFTDYTKNYHTRQGYWKATPLKDDPATPSTKEGFSDGDTVYVFVDYEQAKTGIDSSSYTTFTYSSSDSGEKGNAYIKSLSPQPVSSFSATSLPNGSIQFDFTPTDGVLYNIYYDNQTGIIDYTSPLVSISHPNNSAIIQLPNENYKFNIRAQNSYGKEEENTNTITAICDDTIPTINITSPTDKDTVSSSISIIGSIEDSGGNLKSYSIYLGHSYSSNSFSLLTSGTTPKSNENIYDLDTTQFEDGLYTLQINAQDDAGNKSYYHIDIKINNNTHKISYPYNFSTLSQTVEIKGSTDISYFQKYVLKIGAGENPAYWDTIAESTTSVTDDVLGTLDTTDYSGVCKIKLEIYNTNSVIAYEEELTVYINNTPPTISIETPTTNPFSTRNQKIYIEGTTSPNSTIYVSSDSLGISNFTVESSFFNGSFFYNPPSLVSGENDFTFKVISFNSLASTSTLKVTYDTTTPQFYSLTPADQYSSSDNQLTIYGQTDTDTVLKINGITVETDSTGNFSYTVSLQQGENLFYFQLEDYAHNIYATQRTYYFEIPEIDSRSPVLVDPLNINGSYLNDAESSIYFYLNDEKSGINTATLSLTLNGEAFYNYQLIEIDPPYSYQILLNTPLADGTYNLTIEVEDQYENSSHLPFNFTIDTAPPQLFYYIEPLDSSQFRVKVEVKDENPSFPETMEVYTYYLPEGESFSENSGHQSIVLNLNSNNNIYETTIDTGYGFSGTLVLKGIYTDKAGISASNIGFLIKRNASSSSNTTLEFPDGGYIYFPTSSFSGQEKFLFYPLDATSEEIENQKNILNSRELTQISPFYNLSMDGYTSFTFETSVTIALNYPDNNNDGKEDYSGINEEKLAVFYYNPEKKDFEYIKSFQDTENNLLIFSAQHLSEYVILADTTKPTITETSPQLSSYISQPRFVFAISDLGTSINSSKLEVRFDNKINSFNYLESENTLITKPDSPLSPNFQHTLTIKIYDMLDNYTYFEKTFATEDSAQIKISISYPSPASDDITFRYFLTQNAERVLIKIYNEAGKLIKTLEGSTYSDFNEETWDLVDKHFQPLPNGTYFYTIEAYFEQAKDKKEGKFLVIR